MLENRNKVDTEKRASVSGGVLTEDAETGAVIEAYLAKHGKGYTREQAKEWPREEYLKDPSYVSTTGLQEDLQQLMNLVDLHWDTL